VSYLGVYVYMILQQLEKFSRAAWHQNVFVTGLYLSYILFVIAFTGVLSVNPAYLTTLESALRYYVCFFLIIRFNPVTRRRASTPATVAFDRKMAFSAGVFLLLTSAVTQAAAAALKTIAGHAAVS
jgi:hypothetical protein